MADKKISQLTAADVADLGALNSFFEVSVNTLVTPTSRKLGLGKIATWLATIGFAASNVLAQGVTVAQGTITDPAAGYVQTVAWNDVTDTFIAQTIDVTDTASAAGSLLARWRVGGVDKFTVSKAGAITAGAASFTTGAFSSTVTAQGVVELKVTGNDRISLSTAAAGSGSYITGTNFANNAYAKVSINASALYLNPDTTGPVVVYGDFTVGSSAFVVTAATGAVGIGGGTGFNLTQLFALPASFTNAAGDFAAMWQHTGPVNVLGIAGQTGGSKWVGHVTNNGYAYHINVGGTAYEHIFDTTGGVTFAGTVQTGNLGVGGASAASVAVYIIPSTLTSADQRGVYSVPVFSSAATGTAYPIYAAIQTAAASFTVTSADVVSVGAPTLGLNSAIATLRGINVVNQGAPGVTNAYGIYIAAQSGAATTNIGLYNAGTTTLAGATTLDGGLVTYGANDSGGTGYRLVRVPNV